MLSKITGQEVDLFTRIFLLNQATTSLDMNTTRQTCPQVAELLVAKQNATNSNHSANVPSFDLLWNTGERLYFYTALYPQALLLSFIHPRKLGWASCTKVCLLFVCMSVNNSNSIGRVDKLSF